MNFVKNILKAFRDAGRKSSQELANNLDQGKAMYNWAPRSERYTMERNADMELDKDWVPSTKEEQKTLAPEGYYRTKDRGTVRNSLIDRLQQQIESRMAEGKKGMGKSPELTQEEKQNAERIAMRDYLEQEQKEKTVSVDSTAISNVKYNPKTEGLKVKFQGEGKEYFYPAVPLELIQEWMKAPSKGEFFMEKIHDQYTMNPGHRPAGKSKTYGNMSKAQVGKFFRKYSKKYFQKNRNDGWKKALNKQGLKANAKFGANIRTPGAS